MNLVYQEYQNNKQSRNELNQHKSFVIWITGLSGSGKSTLANALDQRFYQNGIRSYVLDGDNIRTGLNKDLDFSLKGRIENIRRISEVAHLMADAGIIVITAFISPFIEDREKAKQIVGEDNFVEVFVDCPIDVCIQRDVKGLYKKALNGEIKDFTGIDSPYEAPVNPDVTIKSNEKTLDESIDYIFNSIADRIVL